MINQLMLDLKVKQHVMPQHSKLLITPKFHEVEIGLKQFHTFNLVRDLYKYLYGMDGQDASTVLLNQRKMESVFIMVLKVLHKRLNISNRNSLFTTFTDYMEIMEVKPEIDSLGSQHERAAGYVLLLALLSMSNPVTSSDRIVLPLNELLKDLPGNYLLSNKSDVTQAFNFDSSFYTVAPYSRDVFFTASYYEKISEMLISKRILSIIRTVMVMTGSRRAGATLTNSKSFMWMTDSELTSAFRNMLNMIVFDFNKFHASLIDIELDQVEQDQKSVAQFVQYLHNFYEHMISIEGVIDTLQMQKIIDSLNPASDNMHALETDEAISLMENITSVIVNKVRMTSPDEDASYVSTISNYILDMFRQKIRLQAQKSMILNLKDPELENLNIVEVMDEFDDIPKSFFELTPVAWQDIMTLNDRVKITERRISTSPDKEVTVEKIHTQSLENLPINTVTKDHQPLSIQLDYLNGDSKILYVTPMPFDIDASYRKVVDGFNKDVLEIIKGIYDSRILFYDNPLPDHVNDEQINDDFKTLVSLKHILNPVLTSRFSNNSQNEIRIFDTSDSIFKIPLVVPKSSDFTLLHKYEVIRDEEAYKIILVPETEIDQVKGYRVEDYFKNRVNSASLPTVNLSYSDSISRSQVNWPPTLEFSTSVRLESNWLNDVSHISRVVTDRRAHMVRLSIDEILKRLKFRELILFTVRNVKKTSDLLKPVTKVADIFKMVYNYIYEHGSGYMVIDNAVRMYGRYETHQMFAYKNQLRGLYHLVQAVAFVIIKIAYSEQIAIKWCAIPQMLTQSEDNIASIKEQVKKWFSEDLSPSKAEVTSVYDTFIMHVMDKLKSYSSINIEASVPKIPNGEVK